MQKLFRLIVIATILGFLASGSALIYLYSRYSKDLPNYQQLKLYNPLITSRIYSADGKLIKEYSKENRIFVSIDIVPKHLINAFIAAEDGNFYKHSGVDLGRIFRASIINAIEYLKGNSISGGASTITQQVVKNFLLTNERTIDRKIKEAILAFKITRAFSKDRILELYLNQIYLGSGSYGVAAAAQAYFDKSIDELTIEEVALLATLPKAPSRLDPRKSAEKAKNRRDWVINQMLERKFISAKEANEAINTAIKIKIANKNIESVANSFSDNVKKELIDLYGSNKVFESGIMVRTTLETDLQKYAGIALQKGLERYDRRHGYRGPVAKIKLKNNSKNWQEQLREVKIKEIYRDDWLKAVILDSNDELAKIGIIINKKNEEEGVIELQNIKWAKEYINSDEIGPEINKISDALNVGDVVLVKKIIDDKYSLKQTPQVNGAVMAMDPHSGKILAMSGGYIDAANQFNRATQAKRQPGSILKTFGYLTALENGLTPATIIMDEPVTLDQGDEKPPYSPTNYSNKFYGPTTLRIGLEKSINVTTVRVAEQVGLDRLVETIKRFKINDDPEPIYSLVLGSTESTLSKLVTAYSAIVNGGKEVKPSLIEKIQNRNGKTIYKRDNRDCDCNFEYVEDFTKKNTPFPVIKEDTVELTDSATAYQVTSMLEGVVKRGTAYKANSIGKVIGGKTGTTNNSYDSWFVGFSQDLVFGVYVGFDKPKSLGKYETGSSIALPIFNTFMKKALKDTTSTPFRTPNSVHFIKIDRKTGRRPTPLTPKEDIIFESLKIGDKIEGFDNFDLQEDKNLETEQEFGIY